MKTIAPFSSLSSKEAATPFFKPSFQKNINEVYSQYPYVSPDTKRWVFAYTTPIVLNDGSKPAFYHFEMPLKSFQDMTRVDQGRAYVVDPRGYLVADSGHVYNQSLHSAPFGQSPKDFFPSIGTISTSSEFNKDIRNILATDNRYKYRSCNVFCKWRIALYCLQTITYVWLDFSLRETIFTNDVR